MIQQKLFTHNLRSNLYFSNEYSTIVNILKLLTTNSENKHNNFSNANLLHTL